MIVPSGPWAVQVTGLRKSFGTGRAAVAAVRGMNLAVAEGEIFGLLGPNGAGKSTTLRILTTLLPADGGEAVIAGADVRRAPARVRARIGYVGQLGGADAGATGRENLLLAGRLYGLGAAAARARCAELLGVFDLSGQAGRLVRTYSGGQKRRLEIALGIMHRPRVLFLDEPTTGLDPQNRANLWELLRQLRAAGSTVVLCTHYLDEADALCDRIAIIDHGAVIALGSPAGLKQRYSGAAIIITPDVPAPALPALARDLAAALAGGPPAAGAPPGAACAVTGDGVIRLALADGSPGATEAMAAAFALLARRGVAVLAAGIARPSLDDVFLSETGRTLRDAGSPPGAAGPEGAASGTGTGTAAGAGVAA